MNTNGLSSYSQSNVKSFQQTKQNEVTMNTEDSINGEKEKITCKTCMYTGMATCTGLSLYFMKLSSELPEITKETNKEVLTKVGRQRNFLMVGSAAWAVAGIYRAYIG
mmetsp:Transcript_17692/g.24961  ORF Transcript_17692/g.24961 Transcript_17692/m.24961 type:complete len:108 (-) Transcript_17692:336-659(-)